MRLDDVPNRVTNIKKKGDLRTETGILIIQIVEMGKKKSQQSILSSDQRGGRKTWKRLTVWTRKKSNSECR